jgi:hypothetical protein
LRVPAASFAAAGFFADVFATFFGAARFAAFTGFFDFLAFLAMTILPLILRDLRKEFELARYQIGGSVGRGEVR